MTEYEQEFSASELNHFHEHGYVIVEDLYDRSEMQNLKQHAISLALAPSTPQGLVKVNAFVKAGVIEGREGIERLHSLFRPQIVSRRFVDVCCDSKLTDRLAAILGPDVITFNGLVIFKIKGTGLPFPYHQDMWYFSRNNEIAISCAIWMALDDATIENGCLWIVPGSHKLDIQEHVLPESRHLQQEFREVRAAREMDEIPVPLRSGSCLFFHGKLLHRSGMNEGTCDRCCYVIHNTTADTVFKMGAGVERQAIMRTRGGASLKSN